MRKRKNKNYIYKYLVLLLIITFIIIMNNLSIIDLNNISSNIFYVSNKKNNIVNNTEIKELKKEIEELKEINKINSVRTDKSIINASVIGRGTPYWNDYIVINKGKKNKIEKGYAVMNKDGLIGEIIKVNKNTSKVKLLTNINNSYISAKFNYNNKDYYGIIKRVSSIKNELYLDNVIGELDKNIIGKDVTTSGLSSNMPSGLLIGKIIDLKEDKYNLSNTIKVKISADLNDINIVSVIGSK